MQSIAGVESAGFKKVSKWERSNGHIGGMDMKPHIGIIVAFWLAGTGLWAADEKQAAPKGDPRGAALLQEAAKTRYTWSPEVSAVSGKFAWEKDGKAGAGTFRSVLHKRGGLAIKAEGDAEVPAEVKDHIGLRSCTASRRLQEHPNALSPNALSLSRTTRGVL
jgi:hypothetical protein